MAFPLGWQRVCPLVIQQSKVNAGRLDNFPLLITAACLPSEMVTLAGTNAAQSDGGDIRFSSDAAGLSQLACEIVVWSQNATPASAKAQIWVKAPSIWGAYNTTIYVWYKAGGGQTQPAAGSTFGSQSVWSAYSYVWHGGDGATLGLSSSTANANTLTNTGSVTAAAGPFTGGGAANFNGSSNYLSKTSPTGIPTSGGMTIEAWVNPTDAATNRYAVATTASGGGGGNPTLCSVAMQITTAKPYAFINSALQTAPSALSLGAWSHVAHVYGTPFLRQYVNGVQTQASTLSAYSFAGAAEIYIGALDGPILYWFGKVSEVRLSAVRLDGGWLATQYNNVTSPSTFVVAGTPIAPGPYAAPGGFYQPQ